MHNQIAVAIFSLAFVTIAFGQGPAATGYANNAAAAGAPQPAVASQPAQAYAAAGPAPAAAAPAPAAAASAPAPAAAAAAPAPAPAAAAPAALSVASYVGQPGSGANPEAPTVSPGPTFPGSCTSGACLGIYGNCTQANAAKCNQGLVCDIQFSQCLIPPGSICTDSAQCAHHGWGCCKGTCTLHQTAASVEGQACCSDSDCCTENSQCCGGKCKVTGADSCVASSPCLPKVGRQPCCGTDPSGTFSCCATSKKC